ncbi:MAG: hypothetical protein CM15mP120_22540 [Pseudomonadota bacterium]|nr:MAG: hypothetical protein CM15mP120_22540 [Pseudomonadota bacterium]
MKDTSAALLAMEQQQLAEYLKELDVAWLEDPSNQDQQLTRISYATVSFGRYGAVGLRRMLRCSGLWTDNRRNTRCCRSC